MKESEFYRRFPTEEICKKYIERERWNGKPICPHCGVAKVYRLSGLMSYKCSRCRERFSVRTNTIMEGSKMKLQTWLVAIHMMSNTRKGISIGKFAEAAAVTQKTAWFLSKRIRGVCADERAIDRSLAEMDS